MAFAAMGAAAFYLLGLPLPLLLGPMFACLLAALLKAPLKGQEEYQDHGPATDLNIHSINVQAVTCSADGTEASIFGQATVNGSGTFDYRIDLEDQGEPGTSDTYRIRLSGGYDSGEQVLGGGNVQIH